MINLIKNELTKIFKKKSIYITFIIIFIFILFMTIMTKYATNIVGEVKNFTDSKEYIQDQLANTDINNPENVAEIAKLKAKLKILEMKESYKKDSWQVAVLEKKLLPKITELETTKLQESSNTDKILKLQNEYRNEIKKLENDDWMSFAQEDLKEIVQTINQEKELLATTTDKTEKSNIESIIQTMEVEEQVAKWRVEKEIKYGTDYLNVALTKYESSQKELVTLKKQQSQEFSAAQQIQKAEQEIAELKYSIENKQDVSKSDSLRGMLIKFFQNYGLFIIIVVIMIAGSIVSDEFNRGTIKLLLVRPYKRSQILLSKFIAVLIVLIIAILVMAVAQILIGGILLGFDSLQVPALVYNFDTKTIEAMSILQYFTMQAFCNLPIYILLATLAFTINVVLCSTPIAIVMPLVLYMIAAVINQLVIMYNVKILQYFVTLNWDLSSYIGGGLGQMEGLTLGISVVVCVVYFLIMLVSSLIVFKNRDVKNV